MPQQSVATSSFRREFFSRESIHRRRASGTFLFLLSLPVGTDKDFRHCVSGFVSYTTVTLKRDAGNGNGGENAKVCVSDNSPPCED